MHPIKFHKRLFLIQIIFITESSGGKKVENKNALIYFRGPSLQYNPQRIFYYYLIAKMNHYMSWKRNSVDPLEICCAPVHLRLAANRDISVKRFYLTHNTTR